MTANTPTPTASVESVMALLRDECECSAFIFNKIRDQVTALSTAASNVTAYCSLCAGLKPSSFRPGIATDGSKFEDLCCDTCNLVIATLSGHPHAAEVERLAAQRLAVQAVGEAGGKSRGVKRLDTLVHTLRERGYFADEEGDFTDDLADLLTELQAAAPQTSVEAPDMVNQDLAGLAQALRHQKQIDEDGTLCGISREAADDAATFIEGLAAPADKPAVSAPMEPDGYLEWTGALKLEKTLASDKPLYLSPPAPVVRMPSEEELFAVMDGAETVMQSWVKCALLALSINGLRVEPGEQV